jgi:hypothetical protein
MLYEGHNMKDCTFKETTETEHGIIIRFRLEAFLRGLAENEIFMGAKKKEKFNSLRGENLKKNIQSTGNEGSYCDVSAG